MHSKYKTAVEYYKEPIKRSIKYVKYMGPKQTIKEPYVKESYVQPVKEGFSNHISHMKWEKSQYKNMTDPEVWGPPFWFTLHNGAAKYAISASPIARERMKAYILGIPFMLPCQICMIHANNHIEKYKNNLDDICSGREKLFKFFVDFHNIVNTRYNKTSVSVEDAYKMYNGGVDVSTMVIK